MIYSELQRVKRNFLYVNYLYDNRFNVYKHEYKKHNHYV